MPHRWATVIVRGYRPGEDADFPEALAAFPESESEIRAWLLGRFGVHIPARSGPPGDQLVRTPAGQEFVLSVRRLDCQWIYHQLVEARGEARAADIVAELILTKGGSRVVELVEAEARGRDVYIRADDPDLVHLLFEDDWPTELGEYVEHYWSRSRPPDAGARLEPDQPGEADLDEDELTDDEEDGEDLDFKALLRSLRPDPEDRRSADPRSGLAFERVQTPAKHFLTVDPTWNEAQLEAFVIEHWEKIDWGFQTPLYLVGSQVQLDSGTRDRVDILAKGGSGQLVAIELKIGEAKPRDVSQLQAYMTHLDNRGAEKTFGVLVAASFPHRVLNSAAQNRRLRLLRFQVP